MKTNLPLQTAINLKNDNQAVWYMAHVLMAGLTNSPAVAISPAIPAVTAKPEVLAQTAKPVRAASLAVAGAANTVGYGFGELYLNSPAYPAGTAIPAIPTKPASAAVAYSAAVVGSPLVPAVNAPAVTALKGWEDAINIDQSASLLTVTATLPVATSVGLVGSSKVAIMEVTPAALQATAWVDDKVVPNNVSESIVSPIIGESLEASFYRHTQRCNNVTTDVIKVVNGIALPCKKIVVSIVPSAGFDASSDSLQLNLIPGN